VARHLRELERVDITRCIAKDLWVRGVPDLDKLAEELGVAGRGLQQHERHARERAQHQERGRAGAHRPRIGARLELAPVDRQPAASDVAQSGSSEISARTSTETEVV